MALSSNILHMVLFTTLFLGALSHPGHDHGPSKTESASSSEPVEITPQRIAYAWGLIALAFIGSLLGGMLPFIDGVLLRYGSVPPERRSTFQSLFLSLFAQVRSYTFISAALGFSAGVLLFGSFSLIIPGSSRLLKPTLGASAWIVTLALWLAGIAIFYAFRVIADIFIPQSKRQDIPSCPCHGPPVASDRNGVDFTVEPCCEKKMIEAPSEVVIVGDDVSSEGGSSTTKRMSKDDHDLIDDSDFGRLKSIGVMAAFSLALHKIPEGIVTFTAALASPSFGTVLAIAILLHNIPESIAISIPIYASTKSAWRGFCAAAAVGLVQPLGGLIGYGLFLTVGFSDLSQGLVYAPIAGMLTYIAVTGLWPASSYYSAKIDDKSRKDGSWTSNWFIGGVGVMYLSVALLEYA